jgi:formate-dependent nitrite reductase membrane component NrfD
MLEEVLVTARYNHKIDPVLGIWSWEIPTYLFLGGLTAGIMFFAAALVLSRREQDNPFAAYQLPLWAPVVLSVGMGALFLDLEHKLYVWRFYTTFQPASPMSWGSWVLLLIYPVSLLQLAAGLRNGYPKLANLVEELPLGRQTLDFAYSHRRAIAHWAVVLAVALGIYTGILLSAFSARPFWNTGYLGPLFLVSGLSAAAAVVILASRTRGERRLFTRIDLVLLAVELAIIALLLVNLSTGARAQLESAELVLGGAFTQTFWLWFVLPGLLIPLAMELWELRIGHRAWMLAAPLLVLYGGFMLRLVTVEIGQASSWTNYAVQFDPTLLQLLP